MMGNVSHTRLALIPRGRKAGLLRRGYVEILSNFRKRFTLGRNAHIGRFGPVCSGRTAEYEHGLTLAHARRPGQHGERKSERVRQTERVSVCMYVCVCVCV